MIAVPPHRARVIVSAALVLFGLSGCAGMPGWQSSRSDNAPQAAAVPAAPPKQDSESVPPTQLAFGIAPQREDLVPGSPTCTQATDWSDRNGLLQGGIEEG